jgi:uncharacterized Zn-finger protein
LSKHKKIHLGKKFVCVWPQCKYQSKYESALKNHIWTHSEVKKYICDWNQCLMKFRHKSYLKSHKNSVHLKIKNFKYNLEGCNRIFNRKEHLRIHSLIHSGKKSFVCDYKGCEKTFFQKSDLQNHINRHLGIKKFKCNHYECEKKFVSSRELNLHILNKHNRAQDIIWN